MRIDPNSRTVQGLTTFIEFVALNLMFLVCCVPVITIGAATSALFQVTIRYSDDETGRPVADYLPAFARDFRRSGIAAAALLVPTALLLFSAVFWFSTPSVLGAVGGTLALVAAVALFAAFLWAMALIARFRDPVRRTLKNALLLTAAEPVRTFGVLMIPAALVCISILFPPFLFIIATIGFSVGAFASAFLFRSGFSRHLPGAA